jgi:ethanolamine ammonia-lyase small subunit
VNVEKKSSGAAAWNALRRFTPARVAIGRAGGSLTTRALLDFRLAHARARDALLRPLDEEKFIRELEKASHLPVLRLVSAARSFDEYLLRPDLGRQLETESVTDIRQHAANYDLVLIVSDGLSTLALETHAATLVAQLVPMLTNDGWNLAPLCFVRRARVALEDEVGERLGAKLALILLGERPGLTSPDSLGAYLVHAPRRGNTDAQRNCVSNISAHGLSTRDAALKLHWLLTEARRRSISGVALKDECDPARQLPASRV